MWADTTSTRHLHECTMTQGGCFVRALQLWWPLPLVPIGMYPFLFRWTDNSILSVQVPAGRILHLNEPPGHTLPFLRIESCY